MAREGAAAGIVGKLQGLYLGNSRRSTYQSVIDNKSTWLTLQITGGQGASTDDLVAFLWRKCHVKVVHVRGGGEKIICSVHSPMDATTLTKASGIRFAGNVLHMTQVSDSQLSTMSKAQSFSRATTTSKDTIDTLKQFLARRYSAETKMLDLSRIAEDAILSSLGIVANTTTSSKLFMALMKLVSDEKIEVVSVSLESNKLKDVQGVSTLAQHVPKLRNLSLANNDIQRYKDLDAWSNKTKLAELQELILTGNPVCDTELSKGREVEYRSEVTKRFPSLTLLDGKPIAQGITFDVGGDAAKSGTPKVELPAPIAASFYENETIQATVMGFLGKFFPAYDADRMDLKPFYADNAIFSISMNAVAPRKKHGGAFTAGPWTSYISTSRNLTRITGLDARITRTNVGKDQIVQALRHLPITIHDLSDATLFCVDAWSFPTSEGHVHIQICTHGEFKEKIPQSKQMTKRSFDRTFVLGPAGEGQGVDGVIIKSDLLVVRAWGGSDAWRVASSNNQTVKPNRPDGITDQQLETLNALKSQTGLNTHYAGMCLAQMNWDLPAAVKITIDLKAKNGLPAEAFVE